MLRRLRQNGVGLKACATMMGRSYHSVTRQVRYLGLQLKLPQQPKRSHDAGGGIRAGRTTLPPLPSLRHDS